MRLFTAIDLPPHVTEALSCFVNRLRPHAEISWSAPEKLHITTKFIGEWPAPRLPEMTAALAALPRSGAIEVTVKGVGWFPDRRRPRVFWAGVNGGEALRTLAQSTDQATHALGVPAEDRPFTPHLTLARIRENRPLAALHRELQQLQTLPAGCALDFGAFRATQFFLYLSERGQYTRLAAFPRD